jgi:lysyl-tRNA synthetase class 2
MVIAIDAIRFHRFGLAGREPLLLMLAASLLTFAATRLYTRIARTRNWRSGRVGGVHLHHLVVGNILVLICGMLQLAFQPGDIGVDILSVGFGVGAAFVLDEFALSVHLRDVYWTPEGRHSIEVSLMWAVLGLLLLTGISPFGIHDHTEIPRIVGFAVVVVNIVLSVITCLKGKLTLGLLSIFLPPVGILSASRLARPGSVWAQLFYSEAKREAARERFDPATSSLEALRHRLTDLVGGSHQGEAPEAGPRRRFPAT